MEKNYISFLDEYSNRIGETVGLDLNEINQLEQDFNVNFPTVYVDFLSKYGKRSGYFLISYLVTIDKLKNNRESALDASYDEIDNINLKLETVIFSLRSGKAMTFSSLIVLQVKMILQYTY